MCVHISAFLYVCMCVCVLVYVVLDFFVMQPVIYLSCLYAQFELLFFFLTKNPRGLLDV